MMQSDDGNFSNFSNARWKDFLDHLLKNSDPFMEEVREKAKNDHVPIIRRETEYFLRWLISAKNPQKLLEIGTATGYSAISMMRSAPDNAIMVTIEQLKKRSDEAEENFKRAGFLDRISIINDDASEVLPKLSDKFEVIFLDGAKGQYLSMLPRLLELLNSRGVLVCDNILQNGSVLESRFAVRRRDRTIHKRMRDFLYELTHNNGLVTDLLPIGDGIAISVKTGAS